ncbi:MAG: 6-carboxytetrahydropterin synthase, partial [Lysobacteraceae bacterium]
RRYVEGEVESSKRIHGHTYHAEVTLRGEPDPATGMLVDLGVVRRELEPALPLLVRVAVFRPASGDRATLQLG